MNSLLETHAISSGYGGVPVVHDVSIIVGEGEIVALLGANGAGKTTTLLCVSSLLPRLGGQVNLFGSPVGRKAAKPYQLARAGLAHVPEDRALFPEMTVREHLRTCMRPFKEVEKDALSYFPNLEPLMNRRAGLLSGGEQQMLALARALAVRPKLLLVDELSLGLAPIVVESLLPILRKFATERGTGVLIVEQHIALALATADRAYVMARGRIVKEGTAPELLRERDTIASAYLANNAEGGREP